MNWSAILSAGHDVVPGAESLLGHPPGCLAGWPAAAVLLRDSPGTAIGVRGPRRQVAHGRTAARAPVSTSCVDQLDRIRPLLGEADPQSVRHLVEVDRWLAGLADSLARIHPPAPTSGERRQPRPPSM